MIQTNLHFGDCLLTAPLFYATLKTGSKILLLEQRIPKDPKNPKNPKNQIYVYLIHENSKTRK